MNDSSFPYPWIPDQGDGTYRNPVLHADYSDPDVVRVGEDFYLTASSFNCTPGLPILHSRDLVNWRLVNHALKALPDPRYEDVHPGHGVWAPSIRFHDGRFWIVFPTPDEGIYVTTAEDPEGEWSVPHLLLAGKGLIDPCPLWDDDGKAYLVHAYAASRCGIRNRLHVRPMSPDGREILGEGKVVAEIDPALPALEGPKFLKRNGWYYISAPSGGVATGWQTVFRSREIYGPYEEKVVLAQRGTEVNGPHQGGLVDTPAGEWWFLHFQEKQPYGRIVHLQPVRWEDDWPVVGVAHDANGVGSPVIRHRKPKARAGGVPAVPQDSDEFEGKTLGLQWQWQANSGDDWYSMASRPGHLRLRPVAAGPGGLAAAPNLLLQKFPAASFSVATRLELPPGHHGLRAGLVVMGVKFAALDVQRNEGGYLIRLLMGDECVGESVSYESTVTLKVRVREGGNCQLGIATREASFHQLGHAFQSTPGVWIGAKVGLYCLSEEGAPVSGYADFEWFRLASLDDSPDRRLKVLKGDLIEDHKGSPDSDRIVDLSEARAKREHG